MMLVTIFSGPGDKFRVRELAPGSIQAQTMKWADDYDGALSFIDERYSSNEFVDDETFRDEVKRRRGGKAMENLETMKQRWSTVSAEDYKRMDEQERKEYLHFLDLLDQEQQAKFRAHPAYQTQQWENIPDQL